MSILKLQKVKYSEDRKELSCSFTNGKLYSVYCHDLKNEVILHDLFQVLAYFKLPYRGSFLCGDVNIKKLNPTTYRSKVITITTENNTFLENMKVIDYLKYVTNNFENTYDEKVEFIDYLEYIYSLLFEFGLDKKKLKTKIKKLNRYERWQLKLIESLLKGSEVLLLNKTLDCYEKELLDFCIRSLKNLVGNYDICVITFTEEEEVSNKMDYVINI